MMSRKTGTRPSTAIGQKNNVPAPRSRRAQAPMAKRRSTITAAQYRLWRMEAMDFGARELALREERRPLSDRLAPPRGKWPGRNPPYYPQIRRPGGLNAPQGPPRRGT